MVLFAYGAEAGELRLPSSAASITVTADPDLYLVADYSNILLFDRHDASMTPMATIGATRPNVPTGLAYDSRRHRLFIANYLSNNVLVATVDLLAKIVTVEQEFATDQAISPENVSVDPDTGM
jgi:DNA-binding beta-propeller fold protein YncE